MTGTSNASANTERDPTPARSVLLWAFVFLAALLLMAAVCEASRPEEDAREEVRIWIVLPSGEPPNVVADTAEAIRARLAADRFDASISQRPDQNIRALLTEHPEVHHFITDLLARGDGAVSASVYTCGTLSPRSFDPQPMDRLVAQIEQFLRSEEMVLRRATLEGPAGSEYSAALHDGLRALLQDRNAAAAIQHFERAAQLHPESPVPHLDLSLCYKRLGDQTLRTKHVEAGLQLDPNNPSLLNERALIFMAEDNYTQAIAILEGLPANDPITQWNLAYAHNQLGDTEGFREHLEKVVELQADQSLSLVANEQLDALRAKADRATSMRRAMWLSAAVLVCIAIVAVIALIAQRLRRRVGKAEGLSAADRASLFVQLGLAFIGGLFSILTLIMPNLLAGG